MTPSIFDEKEETHFRINGTTVEMAPVHHRTSSGDNFGDTNRPFISAPRGELIEIAGKYFELGKNDEEDHALHQLKALVKAENTNFQPDKLVFTISMVLLQMGMNLALGSTKAASIIGIERCSAPYWAI